MWSNIKRRSLTFITKELVSLHLRTRILVQICTFHLIFSNFVGWPSSLAHHCEQRYIFVNLQKFQMIYEMDTWHFSYMKLLLVKKNANFHDPLVHHLKFCYWHIGSYLGIRVGSSMLTKFNSLFLNHNHLKNLNNINPNFYLDWPTKNLRTLILKHFW